VTYDEIEPGQRVRIRVGKRPAEGIVVNKQVLLIRSARHERVWVDTDRGRRICVPSVLEPIKADA
jgi:hypothetical protein